jgi:hypothetical protein
VPQVYQPTLFNNLHFSTFSLHRLKEFIKEQLVSIPTAPHPPAPAPPAAPVAQPTNAAALTDPGALLAGLL